MSKSQTFQELATKAHDMEVTIANSHDSSFNVVESKNNRAKLKNNVKFSTSSTKEAKAISKVRPVRIMGGTKPKREKKHVVQGYDKKTPYSERT